MHSISKPVSLVTTILVSLTSISKKFFFSFSGGSEHLFLKQFASLVSSGDSWPWNMMESSSENKVNHIFSEYIYIYL